MVNVIGRKFTLKRDPQVRKMFGEKRKPKKCTYQNFAHLLGFIFLVLEKMLFQISFHVERIPAMRTHVLHQFNAHMHSSYMLRQVHFRRVCVVAEITFENLRVSYSYFARFMESFPVFYKGISVFELCLAYVANHRVPRELTTVISNSFK